MLRLQNISRSFPGVKALKNISLEFQAGEIHALCGENGAGKTTLMNIIAGTIAADEGRFFWKGNEVKIGNVQESAKIGIGIVYQEHSLVEAVSVAENIYPVNQPLTRSGLIDFRELYRKAGDLMSSLGMNQVSPRKPVESLSAVERQMVAIAKALAGSPELLILDEPTASLTIRETETLFSVIRRLKQNGVGIIYISHRMAEIREIADRVTVLKDGEFQGTYDARDTPVDTIISKMVGRELQDAAYRCDSREGQPVLSIEHLSGRGFSDISLSVGKGEILGLAGLQDSGRTELLRAIFGDEVISSGKIFLQGKVKKINHPQTAISRGIAYIPEERKTQGLFMNLSVAGNIVSATLRTGWYSKKRNNRVGEEYKDMLGIRAVSVTQPVIKLSGGNQQKVVLAKWLNTKPDLLLINEPTHGVDVGAKADIYRQLKLLTAAGKSILLISSELPELLLLADRIGVMFNGRLQQILSRQEATEEKIAAIASGI
ncbi:MAG TPA: sugar ABC transporter ATP-binding protein [Flavitalea sp.]|nr:sugar ABC transporter ATP-binding protein [Flavitalea sp.]